MALLFVLFSKGSLGTYYYSPSSEWSVKVATAIGPHGRFSIVIKYPKPTGLGSRTARETCTLDLNSKLWASLGFSLHLLGLNSKLWPAEASKLQTLALSGLF